MSIFVSIASYRDPELVRTIRSAIDNASNPDDLFFGLVIQELPREVPDISWLENKSVAYMHAKEAMGAGYARSIAMDLYKDQDYFLQIDSHTIFEEGWDEKCIDQLNKAKSLSGHDKVILSCYPPPFVIENDKEIIIEKDKERLPFPTKQIPKLNNHDQWTAARVEFDNKDMLNPEISSTVLGGFIFADGDIVKEIPYDKEISFFGEEICFAMRAWTRGWDIYSPSEIIVYHFYTRATYRKIWKDKNIRKISWKEVEEISKQKQYRVLCGIEKGIFGAGDVRSLQQYEDFCGYNFKEFYSKHNYSIIE